MYVLVLTNNNLIYILYNKKEQDFYSLSRKKDSLLIETIHEDYKFYYNIYSIGDDKQLNKLKLAKAKLVNIRLVILFKNEEEEFNSMLCIYEIRLNKSVHEIKIFNLYLSIII
jgi:hypothetical protein